MSTKTRSLSESATRMNRQTPLSSPLSFCPLRRTPTAFLSSLPMFLCLFLRQSTSALSVTKNVGWWPVVKTAKAAKVSKERTQLEMSKA